MYTMEVRQIPLARTQSTYVELEYPSESLVISKNSNFVKFGDVMIIDGYDHNHRILCIYEIVKGQRVIHYKYDVWGGVLHLSEAFKRILPVEMDEVLG